jgi:hypothetical protein
MPQAGVLQKSSFLPKGLKLLNKLEPWRTHPIKSVAMLATMSFFHPCLKFSTKKILTVV